MNRLVVRIKRIYLIFKSWIWNSIEQFYSKI